jgi:hypothetical protein
MLIRLEDFKNRRDNLAVPHKGRVVSNIDPLKLGRIKVRIKGLLEETTTAKLPYISCKNPSNFGGKPDSSGFSVPEVGSEVTVEFPFSDIYAGFYTGYWQSALTRQNLLFDDDYPESYGFTDSQIQWWRTNKAQNESEFFNEQQEGLFKLENDGSVVLNIKKDFNINVDGNFNLQVGGTTIILGSDDIRIKADGTKDIYLEGTKDVLVKAGANVKTEAVTDVSFKGTNIKGEGTTVDIKSTTTNVEASGTLNAKGATTKITGTTLLDLFSATLAKLSSTVRTDIFSGVNVNIDSTGLIKENTVVATTGSSAASAGSASSVSAPSFTTLTNEMTALSTLVTDLKALAASIRAQATAVEDDIGGF